MSPGELIDKLSVAIYESPHLIALRGFPELLEPLVPIKVAILIVEFDTEVTMSGIRGFLGNSSGRYVVETVEAMRAVGSHANADRLNTIFRLASASGMTYESIQSDTQALTPHSLTTFRETHGDKWEECCNAIEGVGTTMDHEDLMQQLELYVARYQCSIEPYVVGT